MGLSAPMILIYSRPLLLAVAEEVDAKLVRWWSPSCTFNVISTPAWQGSHQTWKRHHLFELVRVYILIRIRQMDERRASASVVGRVHSRATSVSVNPPEMVPSEEKEKIDRFAIPSQPVRFLEGPQYQ